MGLRALRIWICLGIALVISLVYCKLLSASFCGYDDFLELHRARFVDARNIVSMFTTPHFEGYKYRPLSRLIALVTYQAGGGSALAFRLRNLIFHLLNSFLLAWLALLLFDSGAVAAAAALLFGLHPLANQNVAVAIFATSTVDFLVLLSLALFILSLQSEPPRLFLLGLAMLLVWIGLLSYEPAIAAPALFVSYMVIEGTTNADLRRKIDKRFLIAFSILAAVAVGSYLFMRASVLPQGHMQPVGIATLAKNSILYLVALLNPVDSVMASQWFGTPLPSEIDFRRIGAGAWLMGVVGAVLLAALLWWQRRKIRARFQGMRWSECVFLAVAAGLTLAPLLLFNSHPSESYLYLPVAFVVLLLCRLLYQLLVDEATQKGKAPFFAVIATLAVLFGAACWVRNGRVIQCATIASRILNGFPKEVSRGSWELKVARAPGEPVSHRYGIYGYLGLDTLGTGDYGIRAVQSAMQIAHDNEELAVEVFSPEALSAQCLALEARQACFLVHSEGRVSEFGKSPAGK